MRKPVFAYAKTKAQISCAVTTQLISAFVFATQIVLFLFFINPKFPKPLSFFFDSTGQFVWDLVGKPQIGFRTLRLKSGYLDNQ